MKKFIKKNFILIFFTIASLLCMGFEPVTYDCYNNNYFNDIYEEYFYYIKDKYYVINEPYSLYAYIVDENGKILLKRDISRNVALLCIMKDISIKNKYYFIENYSDYDYPPNIYSKIYDSDSLELLFDTQYLDDGEKVRFNYFAINNGTLIYDKSNEVTTVNNSIDESEKIEKTNNYIEKSNFSNSAEYIDESKKLDEFINCQYPYDIPEIIDENRIINKSLYDNDKCINCKITKIEFMSRIEYRDENNKLLLVTFDMPNSTNIYFVDNKYALIYNRKGLRSFTLGDEPFHLYMNNENNSVSKIDKKVLYCIYGTINNSISFDYDGEVKVFEKNKVKLPISSENLIFTVGDYSYTDGKPTSKSGVYDVSGRRFYGYTITSDYIIKDDDLYDTDFNFIYSNAYNIIKPAKLSISKDKNYYAFLTKKYDTNINKHVKYYVIVDDNGKEIVNKLASHITSDISIDNDIRFTTYELGSTGQSSYDDFYLQISDYNDGTNYYQKSTININFFDKTKYYIDIYDNKFSFHPYDDNKNIKSLGDYDFLWKYCDSEDLLVCKDAGSFGLIDLYGRWKFKVHNG